MHATCSRSFFCLSHQVRAQTSAIKEDVRAGAVPPFPSSTLEPRDADAAEGFGARNEADRRHSDSCDVEAKKQPPSPEAQSPEGRGGEGEELGKPLSRRSAKLQDKVKFLTVGIHAW